MASGHDDHANAVLACAALTMARGYRTRLDWVMQLTRELDLNRQATVGSSTAYIMTGGLFR